MLLDCKDVIDACDKLDDSKLRACSDRDATRGESSVEKLVAMLKGHRQSVEDAVTDAKKPVPLRKSSRTLPNVMLRLAPTVRRDDNPDESWYSALVMCGRRRRRNDAVPA